jgi:hypothetical protein
MVMIALILVENLSGLDKRKLNHQKISIKFMTLYEKFSVNQVSMMITPMETELKFLEENSPKLTFFNWKLY